MKKHLIAAAVAAAVAVPAAAQVTVYGLLDHGYTNIKTDVTAVGGVVTTAKAVDTGADGRMSGSRLGFRGAEDLGAGLKGAFVFETGINSTEQYNSLGNSTRVGFLEVGGSFGTVRLGRQVSETKVVNDSFVAFGNANFSTGSVVGGGLTTATTNQSTVLAGTVATVNNAFNMTALGNANSGERVSNLVRYQTPSFSGITAAVGYAKVNTDTAIAAAINAGTANSKAVEASARFTAGAFDVMVANSKYSTTNGVVANSFTTESKLTSYGTSYSLGATKLFGVINNRKAEVANAVTIEFDDTTVGVSHAMGAVTLLAAVGQGEASQGVVSDDKEGFQLGAVYSLSKRTNVYAVYGSGETSTSNSTVKTDASGVAFGLRHSF